MTDECEYEPKFWGLGDEDDAIGGDELRKFVDEQVGNALTEYVEDGIISLNYRGGGSPTVSFLTWGDAADVKWPSISRDLGDLLLQQIEDTADVGPAALHDLYKALFETYERWRQNRIATNPNCNIPVPQLVDGEAVERDELVEDQDGKWVPK